jgi:preprotein translocase SecF subunit
MRWLENPNFDFIGARRIALYISGILVVISIIAISVKGFHYGIEFEGGKVYVLQFQKRVNAAKIRKQLTKPLHGEPIVKQFGSPSSIMVRTDTKGSVVDVQNTIMAEMQKSYPNNAAKILKSNTVGPRFAKDLAHHAMMAVVFGIIVIFIYILIRFKDWKFSLGSTLALAHDIIIVAGVFSLFNNIVPFSMKIDLTIIAAFLTILGYTVHDNVIVFDRIREYMEEGRKMEYLEMINKALNRTLSRTVITSLTVFFVVVVLFFFGSQVLKGFSFAMILGVVIGTYSSLFVATGVVVELELYQRRREKKDEKTEQKKHRRSKRVRQHS